MPRRNPSALRVAAVGLLVSLPVLYVLSVGPAVWLMTRGVIERATYDQFYAPVGWLALRGKWSYWVIDEYTKAWLPDE